MKFTLWDILKEPWFGLHLPRFALFLILAILAEIYCNRKKVSVLCSFATGYLLLITAIPAIVALHFQMLPASPGDRVPIAPWYLPVTIFVLVAFIILFVRGVIPLVRERFAAIAIIRCVVFGAAVYFAVTAIRTPYAINKALTQFETQRLSETQTQP